MEKKTSVGKIVLLVAVIAIVAVGAFVLYRMVLPQSTAGEKNITVTVVHKDGTSKDFEYKTTDQYLGEVLKENELVDGEEGQYGLYILTVDGETVNEDNEEWWCITKGGESVTTSADEAPIADGDVYELTFTVGY